MKYGHSIFMVGNQVCVHCQADGIAKDAPIYAVTLESLVLQIATTGNKREKKALLESLNQCLLIMQE